MISLDLEQVPVAIHSLSPTAICGISRIRRTSLPRRISHSITETKPLRTSDDYKRSLPLSASPYPRVTRCMDVRIQKGNERRGEKRRNETKRNETKRNETKRSEAKRRTDGTQLAGAAGPPNACGPARVQVPWSQGRENIKRRV